ncbi:MAG TPA: sugar ABC transporter permease [Petrotogaceae bacterium]|nr:sugar ABC transporter permease [Petrotogaceae bacterium]HQP57657.1 sugar ABC transporter permease [Petrotogaceae bacterium]
MKKKDGKYIFWFLAPSLAVFLIFQFIPMIWSFIISFTDWNVRTLPKWVGLGNYIEMFSDKNFYEAVIHTFQFIIMYIPLVLIGGMMMAMLVNLKIKGIGFFRSFYFIPVVSSWVAVSLIWKGILNPAYGYLNYFLSLFGIEGPQWLYDKNWAMVGVVMASVWKDIGFTMVLLLGGLKNISEEILEAAQIDGAGRLKKFFKITLPLMSPQIFFVIMISMINSFQVFDQVMVMTNGGPAGATTVLVEQIYRNAFSYSRMGYACAMSWILLLIILVFSFIQNRAEKKLVFYS